jgi:hypothetical protein
MRRLHPLSLRPPLDHNRDGDISTEELKQWEESMTCGLVESPRFYDILLLLCKALLSMFAVLVSGSPIFVAVMTVLLTTGMSIAAFCLQPFYDDTANRVLVGSSAAVFWTHVVALIVTCNSDLLNTASAAFSVLVLVACGVAGFYVPLGARGGNNQVHPQDDGGQAQVEAGAQGGEAATAGA